MAVRITLSTDLDCPPERVFAAALTVRLLRYVAFPMITFEPVSPDRLPTVWSEREYVVRLRLFGVLPLGTQVVDVGVETVAPGGAPRTYRLRDRGRGSLARRWDHRVTIRETDRGRTRYADEINVEAGVLTPLVWLFAQVFYRYRQHRWRRLVAADFASLDR